MQIYVYIYIYRHICISCTYFALRCIALHCTMPQHLTVHSITLHAHISAVASVVDVEVSHGLAKVQRAIPLRSREEVGQTDTKVSQHAGRYKSKRDRSTKHKQSIFVSSCNLMLSGSEVQARFYKPNVYEKRRGKGLKPVAPG